MADQNTHFKMNSGETALTRVNTITNQFSRTLVTDNLQYESDPLITGYFLTMYKLPQQVFSNSLGDNAGRGSITTDNAQGMLAATCTKINLPNINIDPVIIEGLGGTWIQVPGKMTIDKEVSASNWETANAEVTAIARQWLFTLRDPRTGSARVGNPQQPAGSNTKYIQANYKGSLFYVLTDPNIDRVIFAIEFMGIWPKTVPLNAIANDVTANDKIEVELTFPYDRLFMFPCNAKYAATAVLANRFKNMRDIEARSGEGCSG